MAFAHIPELQLECFIGKDNSFKDTFGRLWWDKPAPTITTKFFSISNGRFAILKKIGRYPCEKVQHCNRSLVTMSLKRAVGTR